MKKPKRKKKEGWIRVMAATPSKLRGGTVRFVSIDELDCSK